MKIILLFLSVWMMMSASSAKEISQVPSQPIQIELDKTLLHNEKISFVSHPTALAMNVQYGPILNVRKILNEKLGLNLAFLRDWDPQGEAHITTVTPPEYTGILKRFISMERMNEIALLHQIQKSDLEILALGHGTAKIKEKTEETFFLIVASRNLIKIREEILKEFIKKGGDAHAWDPHHFFPHITIGYTLRDLHENDGVIKDLEHAADSRFQVFLKP